MGVNHRCGPRCSHTCGESGGKTKKGTACTRPGLWGIEGKVQGHRGLCRQHDPVILPPKTSFDGLTARQASFVMYYTGLCNGNATRSAEKAGYTGTDVVLGSTGSLLLRNPKVRAAIEARYEELGMPASEVVKRMTDDARLDISPIIKLDQNNNPTVYLTPELIQQYGSLIKEIHCNPETGRIERLRFNDSQAARRDMAKIRQLFSDGTVVNVFAEYERLSDAEVEQRLATLATTRLGGRLAAVPVSTNGHKRNGGVRHGR